MKHLFSNTHGDGSDLTLTKPSDWNAFHVYGVTPVSVNTTLDATFDHILATAGAGGITLTLPTAVGIAGRPYHIKKVDSAAGTVVIATTSSQTIDGFATYTLLNQWQYVEVYSDGANWQIRGNN